MLSQHVLMPLIKGKLSTWLDGLGFDYGFMDNPSGVYVVLPEVVIRKGMDLLLKRDGNLILNHLECHADGIRLSLSSQQALVSSFSFPVVLRCLEVSLIPGKQFLRVAYQAESPVGTNVISKIVAFFGQSILTALLHKKIADHPAILETKIDETSHVVLLELSQFFPPSSSFPLGVDGLYTMVTLELVHMKQGLKLVGRWRL